MSDKINLPIDQIYIDPKNNTDILDKRNKQEEKKLIIVNKTLIDQFNYKFAKIKRIVQPEVYGLNENYFGGNIYKLAELSNCPYILIVNEEDITLGIFIPKETISSLTVSELKKLCVYRNLKIEKEMSKDEIIEILTR